jgi:hypothetical protein
VHCLVCIALHPHDALDVLDEALLGPDHGAGPADADVANHLLQGSNTQYVVSSMFWFSVHYATRMQAVKQ